MQPGMMPRPDVSRLGIAHRRIPILAIGGDVYLDTRLQLPKLEALFPELPRLGATKPEHVALERLLSSYASDAGLFSAAVQLLPTDLPFLKDPAYFRDRGDFVGRELSAEGMHRARPEALGVVERAFGLLEGTLLADGREWVLGTEGPSLTDVEAVWPLHWLAGIPGALPGERFSREAFPRVYAWIARFRAVVSAKKKKVGKPVGVSGEEAARRIMTEGSVGEAATRLVKVDGTDPVVLAQGLRKGDRVRVWPTDTGSSGRDVGVLVGIDREEVVFETDVGVRVHAPRHGFRVMKLDAEAKL